MCVQTFLIKQLTLNRDASLSLSSSPLALCFFFFSLGLPPSEETTQGHKLVASSDNPLSARHSHTYTHTFRGALTLRYYPNTHTHELQVVTEWRLNLGSACIGSCLCVCVLNKTSHNKKSPARANNFCTHTQSCKYKYVQVRWVISM